MRLYELHRQHKVGAVRAAQARGREFLLVHRLDEPWLRQEEIYATEHTIRFPDLRGRQHTTAVPGELAVAMAGPFDYHVSVHRFDRPCDFFVYSIALEDVLPSIAIPLLPDDPTVVIQLQSLFNQCYDAG